MSALTKRCPACDQVKDLDDFYVNSPTAGGQVHTLCKKCENGKPRRRTPARVINARARQRATAELIQRHLPEFEALKAMHAVLVEEEMAKLAEEAPEHAVPPPPASRRKKKEAAVELPVVPLKPGPKMEGETTLDRVDVARCTDCHKHHDRGHSCPLCGAEPGLDTVILKQHGKKRRITGVDATKLKVDAEWVS